MKDQTGSLITHWIPVARYISQWVTVEIGRRWQLIMLMILAAARIRRTHLMISWAVSVPSTSQKALLLVDSAGIVSPTTAHTEKAALGMEF